MTDDTPLARKLDALTAKDTFDGRALRLGPAGQPEALSRVLQAIDDTMLLRHAVFTVGSSQVTLRVSGKRLQSVVAASTDLSPPADLVGQPLSISAEDALGQTAQLLLRLVENTGTLTVERRPADASTGQSGSGVGVQALAASWDAAPTVEPEDPVETFLAAWLASAVAYIEIEGDKVVEADGEDSVIDELMEADAGSWATFEKSHAQANPQDTLPKLFLLTGLTTSQGVLVSAIFQDRRYLALIPAAEIGQVTAAWALIAN